MASAVGSLVARMKPLGRGVSTWAYGPGGDLQSIDGIGPAHSARLTREGISDIALLAASSPGRLSERVDVSPKADPTMDRSSNGDDP